MTWGISTALFTQIHVVLSLVGIASGLVVLSRMLNNNPVKSWTALFLATTILTSVTGYPLPPFGVDPPRIVGTISLVLLATAVFAFYVRHLVGLWRLIYVVSALAALYLNVFVGVAQSFQKLPFLQPLAPTQSEPPFVVAQVIVLALFAALGFLATRKFHPVSGPTHS